jgi:A/G-specific adenine glycosylase
MPWRGEKDIYKIWLSEVMLQQTQVTTVIPYYQCWIKKFPNINCVAIASEKEILKAWEGLGYYSRARNFQHACKKIFNDFSGVIPTDENEFLKLKGVGEYILSAVFSIGLGKKIPVIDGNVKRVISRFLGLTNEINSELNNIQKFLTSEIKNVKIPGDFNQAIMDLGRTICKPKSPSCDICPIKLTCVAFKQEMTHLIPIKKKKKQIPHYKMVIGLIQKKDKLLICKRNSNGLLGGMWELPGGKINKQESNNSALTRIFSDYGITLKPNSYIGKASHIYSHFSIEQHGYQCDYVAGDLISENHTESTWISKGEEVLFPIHKASHKLLAKLKVN